MYFLTLTITDSKGDAEKVEYAFADEGKVLVGPDGNAVSCVERSKVADYTEVEEIIDPELDDTEALDILLGGDGV